jgi:hypothetical protein
MSQSSHLNRSDVELLYLGNLETQAARHVEGCLACRRALSDIEKQRAALLKRHPAATYVLRLREEHEKRRRRRIERSWLAGSSVAVAAAAALFIHWSPQGFPGDAPALRPQPAPPWLDDALLAKGEASLLVIRKRQEDVVALQGRVPVSPGDEVRLRFFVGEAGPVIAGVVMQNGEWMPWFEGDFAAGPHTPPETLRVTESPGAGLILLGTPEDVRAARAGMPARVQRADLVWRPRQP